MAVALVGVAAAGLLARSAAGEPADQAPARQRMAAPAPQPSDPARPAEPARPPAGERTAAGPAVPPFADVLAPDRLSRAGKAFPVPAGRLARARAVTDRAAAGRAHASFALFDRKTGVLAGDRRRSRPTNTESVIKAWLAADLLLGAQRGTRPAPTSVERALLRRMIRNSDDDAAETVYRTLGGDASVRRMIEVCRLPDASVFAGRWSLAKLSARDTARLGSCLVPGRHLDQANGRWLLRVMRTVAPDGAFGIQEAEPAGPGVRLAIKNGWTAHGGPGTWNVNCLALWGPGSRWVLAVTTEYPQQRGQDHGAATCRRVAAALFR